MDFSPITEYIEQVLRKEKGVPGCDLVIKRDHEVLLRYSSGVSDYEGKRPVSDRDIYQMYSCTKVMTCVCAMQLVEQGILNLDDPVHKFLPEFESVFLMKDEQKVCPQKTMTVRHLFTMSAGFNYDRATQPILDVIQNDPHAGTVDIVNALTRSPLQFEPGERFLYSLCHDVLAAVVEVASGMRFSQYMEKHIWKPLGMKNTGFQITDSVMERMAALYECYEPGKILPFTEFGDFNLTDQYESGGAGLYSTVEDYSLFADALACGGVGATGNRILKAQTIDLMRTEQLGEYVMDPRFGCAAGPGYGYGLGVRTLVKKECARSSLGEFGWDGAAGSYVMIDPAYHLSIFFAMHVRSWPKLIGCGHAPIRDMCYDVLGLNG
ncbi:MAG: beta-lactamase family protein [Oscillospiraceae bacterium]|nr:beta-lactamase family protein [Oscillospiraceae bacterium]